MKIEFRHISKSFGADRVLEDINLEIESGELVALLGPSGSGKTTLLRILAGLESCDSGQIIVDGVDVTHLPVRERGVGLVFQHYALFKHLDVFENVAFPMRVRRFEKRRIEARVRELLSLVRLERFDHHTPDQLSGGQRQRIALARALASEPKILLLDEPFGSLDAKVRVELRRWLRRLHEEIAVTTVFVTHDHEEAFEVADQVVITNKGRIEQKGSPIEVVQQPANRFVLDFVGNVNILIGRAEEGRARFGSIEVDVPNLVGSLPVVGYVRPQDIELHGDTGARASVSRISPLRNGVKLELLLEGLEAPFEVEIDATRFAARPVKQGETVFVQPRRVAVFPDEGEGGKGALN